MNLNYVKEFLLARKDKISKGDIEELISEINAYQGTESTFADISKIMRTINEYNLSFLTQVQEFEALPSKDNSTFLKRISKAREILCILSMLHTYLVLSIASVKESTYDTKSIRGYLLELSEKKEHYKSEKMAWVTVLKSLTQEGSFVCEMRKMDIEDQLGYVRYKKDRNG